MRISGRNLGESYGGVGSSEKEEKEKNDKEIKREGRKGKNRSSEGKLLLLYFLCVSSLPSPHVLNFM